jgi:Leucine-rich repeat (LRR) protein
MSFVNIGYKGLVKLPKLDSDLEIVFCHNNKLTKIDSLPPKLLRLDCENNLITELCKLPDSLKKISCYNNPLTKLPNLPPGLELIYLSSWQIESYLNNGSKGCNIKTNVIIKN